MKVSKKAGTSGGKVEYVDCTLSPEEQILQNADQLTNPDVICGLYWRSMPQRLHMAL